MNACHERYFPYEINHSYSWEENVERLFAARKTRDAIAWVVMGAIGSLGGMFLLFSSLQVLPNGVNAISELGIGGKVIAGTILGLGVLTTVYGLVRYYGACKATNRSTEPIQKPEPVNYTQEGARVYFKTLIGRYRHVVEWSSGSGIKYQDWIDTAWDELDQFAQAYPELRSEVPEKVIQYDDGHRGFTGATNAFVGALSPHYRALEPRIAPFPYDS